MTSCTEAMHIHAPLIVPISAQFPPARRLYKGNLPPSLNLHFITPLGTRRAFSPNGRIAWFLPLKSQMASFFGCQFGFQTVWPLGRLLQGPIRLPLLFCLPSLCLRSLKSGTGCFHPTLTIHDHHSTLWKSLFKKQFTQ